MAYRFHQQMKVKRWSVQATPEIRAHPDWPLQDYKDFMWCIDKGYIIQESIGIEKGKKSHAPYFVINPERKHCMEGQGFDMYAKQFKADSFNPNKCLGVEGVDKAHVGLPQYGWGHCNQ